MKTINDFICESKIKNLFIPEYDISSYFVVMLETWLKNVKNYNNLLLMDNYTKISLCRQCEGLIYLLDKFSDDIPIHFIAADKNQPKDKMLYSNNSSIAQAVYTAFNVIMKVLEVEVANPKAGLSNEDDLEGEIKELKTKFEAVVEKFNKKWHEKFEKNSKDYTTLEVPCGCDCCAGECSCEIC